MRVISVLMALLSSLAFAGCSSKEEKLVDSKMEMRKALDAAYAAYGGGDLLASAKAAAQKDPRQETQLAAQAAAEADRTVFEQYCIATGNGDRLFNFSPKLDAWLKIEKNAEFCKKAAKAARKVEELELKAARG